MLERRVAFAMGIWFALSALGQSPGLKSPATAAHIHQGRLPACAWARCSPSPSPKL